MTPTEIIRQHLQICDELHQLGLDENRFLKQQQRIPDGDFLDVKRALLARLEQSLETIKSLNISLSEQGATKSGVDKALMEKTRSRIMQILHLDRENEQLLLRYSMGAAHRPSAAASTPPPASQLQRLYKSRV